MATMTEVVLSIIVANRNGKHFLEPCLDSLLGEGEPSCPYEVIVADNASTDGSVELVRSAYPSVRGVFNETDLGYTRSNNRAVEAACGRYVMLLNNDTLVPAGSMDMLVAFLEEHPKAAGVGAHLVYADGSNQHAGRRFPKPVNALFGRLSMLSKVFEDNRWYNDYICATEVAAGVPFECDWISHAGALYRKNAWHEVGGLPDDMYYWNEPVFTLWLKRRNWTIHSHPNARIIHYEGLGGGERSRVSWRWHHLDFASGSLRFYAEQNNLGTLDPRLLVAWLGLYTRAALHIGLDFVRPR